MQPALALTVEPLNVRIAGCNTSPDDVLQVSVDSIINGHAKLTAKGKVIPRGGQVSAHIEATDLALPVIQPYISRYTSMGSRPAAVRRVGRKAVDVRPRGQWRLTGQLPAHRRQLAMA